MHTARQRAGASTTSIAPTPMRFRKTLLRILLVLVVLAGVIGIAVYSAVGTFAVAIPESLKCDQPGTLVRVDRTGNYPRFAVKYIFSTSKNDLTNPVALP
jgi:hypothetical protein